MIETKRRRVGTHSRISGTGGNRKASASVMEVLGKHRLDAVAACEITSWKDSEVSKADVSWRIVTETRRQVGQVKDVAGVSKVRRGWGRQRELGYAVPQEMLFCLFATRPASSRSCLVISLMKSSPCRTMNAWSSAALEAIAD